MPIGELCLKYSNAFEMWFQKTEKIRHVDELVFVLVKVLTTILLFNNRIP